MFPLVMTVLRSTMIQGLKDLCTKNMPNRNPFTKIIVNSVFCFVSRRNYCATEQ